MRNHGWRLRFGACLVSLAAALSGCGGDSSTPTPTPEPPIPPVVVKTGSVSGFVYEAGTGLPIAAATVRSGTLSATTDAKGAFTLAELPVGDALLAISHAGHAGHQTKTQVQQGVASAVSASLVRVGATASVSAVSGGSAQVPNSTARVTLPANAVVDAKGAAYTGTIAVEITPIDPATDAARMPGGYMAQPATAGAAPQPMESLGALTVTLRDSAGQDLQLAKGVNAVIRIPLATRSPEVPATIPLFYLNEATGLWVQEGEARLVGEGSQRYYEGQVSHFTTWNADRVYDSIRVHGCVQDDKGQRKSGVPVFADGVDYSARTTAYTGSTGEFDLVMRRGSVATLFAQTGDLLSNFVKVGPSSTDITLPSCLVLSASTSAPVILQQPQDANSMVAWPTPFTVYAAGARTLSYQWSRDGVPIAGATQSTFEFVPTGAADDNARFTVKVSNEFGSVTSLPATLHLTSAASPVIYQQPASQKAAVGATVTFRVDANAAGFPTSYQWQQLRAGAWTDIAGATGASYTTPKLTAADNGVGFRVVVTANKKSVNSDTALLSVAVPLAPVITTQPRDLTVSVGQNASLSVVAEANEIAPVSYQWQRNGVDIAGATSASYVTPVLELKDSGSRYQVVLSNSVGKVTSSSATVTVNAGSSGGSGYYLLSYAGPSVNVTTTFADGPETSGTPALVAVKADNPGLGTSTVEAGGQMSFWNHSVIQASVSGGQVSNVQQRYYAYFKGSRLYKVDQSISSGVPVPALLSSLKSSEVCGRSSVTMDLAMLDGMGNDFVDPSRSWMFMVAPGPDGRCDTSADNQAWAVRLNMDGGSSARLIDMPVAEIRNNDGTLAGFVLRKGTQLSRVDADLGSPTALFKLGSADFNNLSDGNIGSSGPGIWLFIEGGKLYGVDLAKLDGAKLLATLAADESHQGTVVSDGPHGYLALTSLSGTRILHITDTLAVDTLATLDVQASDVQLTSSHVVVQSLGLSGKKGQVIGIARAGGAKSVLYTLADGEAFGQSQTSGGNVYVNVLGIGPSPSVRTLISAPDGGSQQWLPGSMVVGWMGAKTWPARSWLGGSASWALFMVDGAVGPFNMSGGTLRSVQGDTRQTLVTYGKLPTGPMATSYAYVSNYGQASLLPVFSVEGSGSGSSFIMDLLYLKTDAPGLTRMTNFLPSAASPAAKPAKAVKVAQDSPKLLSAAMAKPAVLRRTQRAAR